ncbi:MAG: dethiobiotin synthase [Verrucomicrobia bacterium]|nr:MAG: dethiobiotin synthase [Verrucomicrobiota bacterium]
MKTRWVVVTGADTGVGKTVVAVWLLRAWRESGRPVPGFKPLVSGGRADARRLHAAARGLLPLDTLNPWHYRPPVTPMLAARRAGRPLHLADVLPQLRAAARPFPLALLEGAGGLLSPLGEDFDTRTLIRDLRATPLVVCPNRLGALNQCLLAAATLPRPALRRALFVLVDPPRPTATTRSNLDLLAERLGPTTLCRWPWLGDDPFRPDLAPARRAARQILRALEPRL